MRKDNRLPRILHVLIHLDRHEKRMTSDTIAKMLGTNPVVVRRTLGGLREKGYVSSSKGAGGGWQLKCSLSDISLHDVYEAIGAPILFSVGSGDNPSCLVEQAVDASLKEIIIDAEEVVRNKLSKITVADLANDFDQRLEKLSDE